MNRAKGELAKTPNSSGDAPAASVTRHSRKRPHLTPKREYFDVRRAISSWSSEQLDRLQPWEYFADTSLISIPKSAEEMTRRIENNADLFRTNYGMIFVVILAGCVVSSMAQVMSIVAVGAVCAALSLHEDVETAFLWGRRLPMTKNQRLLAAALVALPLLCAADFFSTVFWSLGAIMVIATTHAAVHAGLGSPIKSLHKNVPENTEKGDVMGHL